MSRKPFILHSFDYPPLSGGIARLCGELAERMARKYDVTVLAETSQASDASIGPDEPSSRGSYSGSTEGIQEIRVTANRPLREARASLALRKLKKTNAPVICGAWYPEGLLCSTLSMKPLIVLAHGAELFPPRYPVARNAWKKMAKTVLTQADLVVANSQYTRRLVMDIAPQANAVAIPLGVDAEKFTPSNKRKALTDLSARGVLSSGEAESLQEKFVIGSVSRIFRFKGFETVFEALAKMAPQHRKNVVFMIAGSGPDRFFLQRAAERLGVASNVKWLGQVPETHLPTLYQSMDLFALCTREEPWNRKVEGFGLVFLEAQACGIPVVGTATGGISDAVSSGNGGWLIGSNDSFELSRLIVKLQLSESLRAEASAAARERVLNHFTWDHFITRFENELTSLPTLNEEKG